MKTLLACTLVLVACASAVAQEGRPLYVGLVRGDGIVVPFAAFDDTGVIDWDPRDLWWIDTWYFFGRDGSTAELRVGATVEIPEDWYDTWGQMTDLSPRDFEPGAYPVKRVGIALSHPRELIGFERMEEADGLRERLAESLRPVFDRLEAAEAARIPAELDAVGPAEIESIDAAALAATGDSIFYVSAERRYSKPDHPSCFGSSLLYTWVLGRGKKLELLDPRFFVTDCDYREVRWLDPLGVLEVGGRTFVLVEEYGWEQTERYVLELTAAGLRRSPD